MAEASLSKREYGSAMESAACQYLETQRLTLLARNFQCRYGEIDLVMWHHSDLVFVEVRYRQEASYGGALMSVTPSKQSKLITTAQYFLQKQGWTDRYHCRFDVVGVAPSPDNNALCFDWIQDAFQTH